MLALILLAALAASTAGSPSAVLELGDKAALQRIQDVPYTVALLKSLKHLGPAALISPNYVLAAAHIVGDSTAASLKVRAGTAYSFWLNPLGVTVEVSQVQLHPDWQAGQDAADVAVLTLAKSLASSSTAIAAISVLGVSAPPPGSRAVVSGWGWSPSLKSEKVWLVLPKYCEAQEGLCVTAAVESGAPLAVDGQLVGFASKQSVNKNNNVQPVGFGSLAEPAVQKFIAAATTPVPPTPETTAAPEPTTETTPSEASTKSPPRPSSNSGVASDGAAHAPRVTECAIHVNGGLPSNNQPILVRPDLGPDGLPAFREPDNGDAVLLAAGERVRLVCSGKGNYFKFNKAFNDVLAECVSDTAFLINGKQVEVHQLACKTTAVNDAVRAGRCLDGKYTSINIGFKVGEGFVTQIENCFNDKTLDVVYSRMVMSPAIAGHESGVKRPSFSPGAFYEGVDVNKLYKAQTQRATVGKLLGDPALGDKYIQDSQHGDRFLARGHLAAKADFIQGAQQRATFYYVNAAPQWQTFNGGNWAKLEDSVRDYVMQGNKTVQVVTGTWGTASLPNKDGVDTPLYLQGDRKLVRVPKYYWKVVYHPETKSGVAFVGLNNPYHDLTAEDVFCEDVCGQYSWATWKPQDQSHGYGFCCDVNELKKVVDTLPADIVVDGLL